jgi:pilus assembly protein CpaC
MLRLRDISKPYHICILFIIVLLACPFISYAASPAHLKMKDIESERISVPAGKSVIVDTSQPVRRVAVTEPPAERTDRTNIDYPVASQAPGSQAAAPRPIASQQGRAPIVTARVISPRQIYINGRMPGSASITLWGQGDTVIGVLDVDVVADLNRLKEEIYTMFPAEKGIRVSSSLDHVTLSGTASSLAVANQVLELARAYAPDKDGKSRIINILEVGGVQQVMLEVRVSEMSRSLARRLGFNFSFLSASGKQFGVSLLNNLISLPREGWPGNPINVTSNINGILNFLGDGATWTVFIDALKENGLLKVLAEPTLITLSGKEARFLAGGEFPIPVPQGVGGGTTITIQYKPFGVGLAFTPVVLSNGKINMQVAPEVSDLDFTTAVALQGFIVPSITTRRVSTTVELADGQSFAIAGLLKEDTREVIDKFPVLGDIPVLGALFRSSSYQRRDTELIVIVTPHLVKPLDTTKQTKPTDQFVDPDDLEFYLLGMYEGMGEPKPAAAPAGRAPRTGNTLEGTFGHLMPDAK